MASRLGPAKPRGSTWNGAGVWLIFSQSRQVNFSRTCCTTFHCRGSLVEPAGAGGRTGNDDPLARQMGREWRPCRLPAREGAHLRSCCRGLLGRDLVLGRGGFQLFERKLHLVDKTRLALVARLEQVAL